MAISTLFQDFNKCIEDITIEDLMFRIKTGHYAIPIKPLRILFREGNKIVYDSAKRKLLAFTPSGQFKRGRKIEYLVKYTQILVLDWDHLTEEEMARIKPVICKCINTLACFVSPSGNGLKVLVCVSTGVKDHKRTFQSVQQFYQNLTGVVIDSSGSDVMRLCFVSYDPDLYYNPGATIFNPGKGTVTDKPVRNSNKPVQLKITPVDEITGDEKSPRGIDTTGIESHDGNDPAGIRSGKPPTAIPGPSIPGDKPAGISEQEMSIFKECVAKVERFHVYTLGNRNNFVYALAYKLYKAGVSRSSTTKLLLQYYNYLESEVLTTIASAYKNLPATGTTTGIDSENNQIPQDSSKTTDPETDQKISSVKDLKKNLLDEELIKLAREIDPVDENVNEDLRKTNKRDPKLGYDFVTVEQYLKGWYEFHYNEVTGRIVFRENGSDGPFDPLTDIGESSIFCRLHRIQQNIPASILHNILYSDFSPFFNPFHDYFNNLPAWDQVTDYIGQLCDTLKCTDTPYWEFCFRKWIVGFVSSLMVDENVNQTVIVFIGGQGVGKSFWIKYMIPLSLRKYSAGVLLQADHKDTLIQLTENALLVLDEMQSMGRKDLAAFKELVTHPGVKIRRPYGRNTENLPHRASLISSVNDKEVLNDTSGSRRYLCFDVIDVDYQHHVDIDGVMAQAFFHYKQGFMYWFDQDEIKVVTDKNDEFTFKSIEEELIVQWLRRVTPEEWKTKDQFVNRHNITMMSATEICTFLCAKAKIQVSDFSVVKIGRVMAKYKFVKIKNVYSQYLVRIVEATENDNLKLTWEDVQDNQADQDADDQIIRFEEDLFNNDPDNFPPDEPDDEPDLPEGTGG